jgi:hypothetical protein
MDMPHSTYNMARGMGQTSVSERAMKLSWLVILLLRLPRLPITASTNIYVCTTLARSAEVSSGRQTRPSS